MQKKIIALAVAAVASGAAFAQSNVVISGNLNYQFENISGTSPTMTNVVGYVPQAAREGRGRVNENSSNLKFSVTEDLGNGLKAMVVVESGIQPTDTNTLTGAAGTAIGGGTGSRGGLGGRDSYIGMSGAFGTILAGRLSVHYTSQAGVDGFGANTATAANSLAILHGNGGTGYGLGAGGRLNNTVAYVTPTFNGFNATFGYARPNNTGANDGVFIQGNNVVRKESGWTVKANFDNGPITAFLSYIAHNDIPGSTVMWQNTANSAIAAMTSSGTNSRENRGFRMGAAYSFPMGLKVGLIYDNTKTLWRDDSGDAITANDDLTMKRTAWVIPVSMTFGGKHTIGATYGKAGNIQTGGTISTADAARLDTNGTAARYWMAGYQYAFSKRTNMGVTFARIDNDQRASYDFFANGAMGQVVTSTTVNTRGSDPTSVSIGLKHSF